ncbi:MAG TPA: hypothetical protein DDZ80_30775 [Cyanobacteria bacterium UBA8803]|nr:hypothetical protein [Cyanobacteria bacterium UBA9273]HBL62609.1 hypothetical protein [Cyanobacteria bacterium UBA8803]
MAKIIPLSLCLLASILWCAAPATAAMSTTQTATNLNASPPIVAQTPTPATNFKLTLEDLPSGFQELPPELTASLASQFQLFRQQFSQVNLNPDNLFAFVNPESFQVVMGFTSVLPNESDRTMFDVGLQQLQQPETQQLLVSELQQKLQGMRSLGSVKVLDYKPLPQLNNLADTSTGFTLGIEMRRQPMRFDMATFRRNDVVAFTTVMYLDQEEPLIGVGEVARKLDNRIFKSNRE